MSFTLRVNAKPGCPTTFFFKSKESAFTRITILVGSTYFFQGTLAAFFGTALVSAVTAQGASASSVASLIAAGGLPWGFKFLWGPILDSCRNRKINLRIPWVVGLGLISIMLFALIRQGDLLPPVSFAATLAFSTALVASMLDVHVDALAIYLTPPNAQGRINGVAMGSRVLGTAAGAGVLGFVVAKFGISVAAVLMVGIALVTLFVAVALTPAELRSSLQLARREGRAKFFNKQTLRLVVSVLLISLAAEAGKTLMDWSLLRSFGWQAAELSILKGGAGLLIGLTSAIAGGALVDRFGSEQVLKISAMSGAILYLLFLFSSASGLTGGVLVIFEMLIRQCLNVAICSVFFQKCIGTGAATTFSTIMAATNLAEIIGASALSFLTKLSFNVAFLAIAGLLIVGMCVMPPEDRQIGLH